MDSISKSKAIREQNRFLRHSSMLIVDIHFRFRDIQGLRVNRCEKLFHADGNQKKAR
jgi:hypothetical protein